MNSFSVVGTSHSLIKKIYILLAIFISWSRPFHHFFGLRLQPFHIFLDTRRMSMSNARSDNTPNQNISPSNPTPNPSSSNKNPSTGGKPDRWVRRDSSPSSPSDNRIDGKSASSSASSSGSGSSRDFYKENAFIDFDQSRHRPPSRPATSRIPSSSNSGRGRSGSDSNYKYNSNRYSNNNGIRSTYSSSSQSSSSQSAANSSSNSSVIVSASINSPSNNNVGRGDYHSVNLDKIFGETDGIDLDSSIQRLSSSLQTNSSGFYIGSSSSEARLKIYSENWWKNTTVRATTSASTSGTSISDDNSMNNSTDVSLVPSVLSFIQSRKNPLLKAATSNSYLYDSIRGSSGSGSSSRGISSGSGQGSVIFVDTDEAGIKQKQPSGGGNIRDSSELGQPSFKIGGMNLHPEEYSVLLNYDHMANGSLRAIDLQFPTSGKLSQRGIDREGGDRDFLLTWWCACQRHDLFCDELSQLHTECGNMFKSAEIDAERVEQVERVATKSAQKDSKFMTKETYTDVIQSRLDQQTTTSTNSYAPNESKSGSIEAVESLALSKLRAITTTHIARVICVGDVHGCYDELRDLLVHVKYRPGDLVLLLGDMVAKGPASHSVVRLAREIGAISVRGNHDFEVIRNYLLDKRGPQAGSGSSKQPTQGAPQPLRTKISDHLRIARSMDSKDMEWLMRLPYYIHSPDLGSLFVHAGMIHSVDVARQNPWVMMNVRSATEDGKVSPRCLHHFPWAKYWEGPLTIYFGHDAARGLQIYDHAMGLDTGCVYGERLSAIMLPSKQIVSVPARKAYIDSKKSQSHKSLASSRSITNSPAEMAPVPPPLVAVTDPATPRASYAKSKYSSPPVSPPIPPSIASKSSPINDAQQTKSSSGNQTPITSKSSISIASSDASNKSMISQTEPVKSVAVVSKSVPHAFSSKEFMTASLEAEDEDDEDDLGDENTLDFAPVPANDETTFDSIQDEGDGGMDSDSQDNISSDNDSISNDSVNSSGSHSDEGNISSVGDTIS